MKLSAAAFVAMIAAMLISTPARAQVPTGTILGTVKDAQGAVVPGATVTATNLGTQCSRNTVTDSAGEYALRLLPVGNYKVEVSIPGFKTFTQTGIQLEVGRNARLDATIELGAVSETVSVVGHGRRPRPARHPSPPRSPLSAPALPASSPPRFARPWRSSPTTSSGGGRTRARTRSAGRNR